jgi:hypothetical protein
MAVYQLTRTVSAPLSLPFVPITTTAGEDSFTFIDSRGCGGSTVIEMKCDQLVTFRAASGGNGYPIPANTPFRFYAEHAVTFYVLGSGAGTLNMIALGV